MPELAEEICNAVSCSSKGIKQLCKEYEHWPSHDTIYRWLAMEKEFSDLYARAKRLQIEVIVDEILEIADDTSNDSVINGNQWGQTGLIWRVEPIAKGGDRKSRKYLETMKINPV